MANPNGATSLDTLPSEIEHSAHEFLRVAEVCALRGVSRSWRARVGAALRELFLWDLRHFDGLDPPAHQWLQHVAEARVNVRSLRLDKAPSVILAAASAGFAGSVELLVTRIPRGEGGGDILTNSKNRDGGTPLHCAAMNGHCDVAKVLLALPNVDVNLADRFGRTPLHWAATNGHHAVASVLISVPNIELNCRDNFDRTPLNWAATNGLCDVTKVLVAAPNVDVTAVDSYGRMSLHWAAMNGHCDVVKVLTDVPNVDVTATDSFGKTSLHWAAVHGHCDVAKVLKTVSTDRQR